MTRNNYIALLLLFGLLVFANGCDEIEGPKKDYSAVQGNSSRRVLMEEFTGQRCPNCPNANAKAQELDSIFGEKLIIISVHATAFAVPVPSLGYPFDYRTPMGDELAIDLGANLDGLPNGAINRTLKSQDLYVWKFTEWTNLISNQLTESPSLEVGLESTYDATTRNANVTVDMEFFEEVGADAQLVVVLTEDSIISKQLDITTEYPDYVHRHVLRASLSNGTYGDALSAGTAIAVGAKITRTYSITIPTDWDAAHCAIVAYVHTLGDRKVLQANEVHLD